MLRRIAGHLTPPSLSPSAPPTPLTAAPTSATSSVVSALAGAAVALATSTLVARQRAKQSPEQEPAVEASKDPNVVQTVEQLRELLPVANAAYGATGLEGKRHSEHLTTSLYVRAWKPSFQPSVKSGFSRALIPSHPRREPSPVQMRPRSWITSIRR